MRLFYFLWISLLITGCSSDYEYFIGNEYSLEKGSLMACSTIKDTKSLDANIGVIKAYDDILSRLSANSEEWKKFNK